MVYSNDIVIGNFVSRPNRFIAKVIVNGQEETVHVKNTGRCNEILIPGCQVVLARSFNPNRRTKYDLIASWKELSSGQRLLINIDSQIPNDVAEEWLRDGNWFSPNAKIKREVTYDNSRFDFYIEDEGKRYFLEVKGVTLEKDGLCSFPDAPTIRGSKHIQELIKSIDEGYNACLLFIVQMSHMTFFEPNKITDSVFSDLLNKAIAKGVDVRAMECEVTPNSIKIIRQIPVKIM